jgi:hypothetical protein
VPIIRRINCINTSGICQSGGDTDEGGGTDEGGWDTDEPLRKRFMGVVSDEK